MASTGIAAVNLGDAVTINSQLGYFDTADMEASFVNGYLQQRLRRLRQAGVERLVLDEVSMMEARQLTALVRAIDDVNKEASVLMGHDHLVALTVVGDFLQLPPVQGDFAFRSEEWPRFHVETLTEIRRQGDPDFIRALRAARSEDIDGVLSYFGNRLHPIQDADYEGTTVLAKNAMVDRLNQLRHDRLPGTPEQFMSQRWGKERGEWKNIPLQLLLKANAQVMVLANRYEDTGGGRELVYANGDNATFLGKTQSGDAEVLLTRTGGTAVIKWISRENKQALKDPRYVCSNKDCNHPAEDGRQRSCELCGAAVKKVMYEVVGELTYMPLRLAYATTIHKSQGLTLDRVQVVIGDPFFKHPGMLYVALSRARTPEGLRVVGTREQLRARCRMDPAVKEWR
jgi:ATP-dependent DNA helicase PIF1